MKLCLFFGFFIHLPSLFAYKHVIVMHGVLDSASVFNQLKSFISKDHPGTNVTYIDMFDYQYSLLPMWRQIDKMKAIFIQIMNDNPEGVHLIGYSQGGLICRGLIESLPFHNIQNFISLSSPQAGQYGDTSKFRHFFPHYVKKEMYRFFYSRVGQHFSVGNYWNDPHHQALYLNYSVFLPVINNHIKHNASQEYKRSMIKLKNMILIGGADDGVITPWQSSHFAAYNQNETVIEMKDQEWYKSDWFGLKTLDQRNSLHIYEEPHIIHHQWVANYTVFRKYIEPWLE